MVSTKFYYNVRDTQEQLFTAVVAVLQRSYKTSVLKKFAIFAGKNLCQSLFLVNFVKRRLQFSCEYCKIFKNSFFIEHLRWLLLQVLHKKEVPKNFATSLPESFFIKLQSYKLQLCENRGSGTAVLQRILSNFSEQFYSEQL